MITGENMTRKGKKKLRKLTILFLAVAIFILCLLLDRKKVYTISPTVFKEESDYQYFLKEYDAYPEELLESFSKNPDMVEYMLGYPTKKGKIFSDTIGELKDGEVPLLLQYDERWGYGMYGSEVIAINGCGPTALAMVVATLTKDNTITPYVVATYASENGYYIPRSGSSWNLMSEGSLHFGVKGTAISLAKEVIFSYLEKGNPIICSMRPGDFTSTGHFIVLTGIQNGKIKVNDSNSRERSSKLWDYETLEPQIRNLWVFEKA